MSPSPSSSLFFLPQMRHATMRSPPMMMAPPMPTTTPMIVVLVLGDMPGDALLVWLERAAVGAVVMTTFEVEEDT